MQLPDSLQPWREWLEWFAPEQLPLFADLLGRLNPMLGPLRGLQQGGVPEPDGLGDLQRRGPYERLLSSEWLLADEVPDEFLRRAVVGEHMFLAPQYRAQQASRLIVVLFDAGPLQLGSARLVHMALLILLARRAKEAGAELRWGILQHEPLLHELDSVAQLKRLLSARTFTTVNDAHWQTWRQSLQNEPMPVGECWLVGQRLPVTDRHTCTHRVQVSRSLEGQSLSVQMQAGETRRVSLPIPDERLAVQLLKGHFEGEVVQAAPSAKGLVPRVSLTLQPVISSAGTHVALKMLDEPGMVVIKLPAQNQKKPIEVRRNLWAVGQTPLAPTFFGRALGAVLSDQWKLSFWNMPGLKPVDKPCPEELKLPPGTATFLSVVGLRNHSSGRLFLLDAQGHLAFWMVATGRSPAKPISRHTHHLANNVMGLAKTYGSTATYVRREGNRLHAHTVDADGEVSDATDMGLADHVSQVLFVGGRRRYLDGCALLTLKNDECESWRVVSADGTPVEKEWINLAPGWEAIGLLKQDNEPYSLLLLGRQAVAIHYEGEQRVLFTTTDTIAKSSFCPMSGVLAVLTSARELLVYSVPKRLMRLQVLCNEQPENKDSSDA
ncbi:hypothetical protein JFT91_19730 [Pseudomonas sp. TH08]|uniref:hypothetical protein n=1 Tax=Pseudomonas sp. TH08 TaxID=2796374 RepID=UPI001913BA39|nr:hypothetical protein [Pseudomonas sp. TH08]MBK5534791.1 hypothetical protein [Pseudomonas sp. TH08]